MLRKGTLLLFLSLVLQGCSTTTPRSLSGLDASVDQAIIVHQLKTNVKQAHLSIWQRGPQGWRCLYSVRAVIGRNGMADVGQKREGDGKTPSGTYALGPAFGYAPSINTGLFYRQATADDFWVDDIYSMQYNQWVHGAPAANSFEHMRRPDNLYRYGVVIDYNQQPIIPGAGSAIFMHVWRGHDRPTAGCVALNQRHLRRMLAWLKSNNHPVVILEKN